MEAKAPNERSCRSFEYPRWVPFRSLHVWESPVTCPRNALATPFLTESGSPLLRRFRSPLLSIFGVKSKDIPRFMTSLGVSLYIRRTYALFASRVSTNEFCVIHWWSEDGKRRTLPYRRCTGLAPVYIGRIIYPHESCIILSLNGDYRISTYTLTFVINIFSLIMNANNTKILNASYFLSMQGLILL